MKKSLLIFLPPRPSPLVDPSAITPTDIIDLKTVVRGGNNEHLLHHPQFQPPPHHQQQRLQVRHKK